MKFANIYRTAAQESVLLREILRRSRTLPGVEEAAVGDVAALPLGHSALEPLLLIREGHETRANQAPVVGGSIVSPEYFQLLGIPLLRGRLFSDQDLEWQSHVFVHSPHRRWFRRFQALDRGSGRIRRRV